MAVDGLSVAVGRALRAARRAAGTAARCEVLAKAASGRTLRRADGAADEAGPFHEAGLAVSVTLPDGRGAIAAGPGWADAERLADEAAYLARLARPAGVARLARPALAPPVAGRRPGAAVPDPAVVLAGIEEACRATDARVAGLDRAFCRLGEVETLLADDAGRHVPGWQRAAQVFAAAVARDGLRAASANDAWAGAPPTAEDAQRLGAALGTAALLELVGVSTPPAGELTALLAPAVLGEITHALAPGLVGLVPVEASPCGPTEGAGGGALALVEDANEAVEARWPPVDGAGRPLERLVLLRDGRLTPPATGDLPLVRPGLADPARPGWLRLSWEDAGPAEVAGGRAGVEILTARTLEADPRRLIWRGLVSGWRLEDGRRRHALARVPWRVDLLELVARSRAVGPPVTAHASGAVRAVPLLAEGVRLAP